LGDAWTESELGDETAKSSISVEEISKLVNLMPGLGWAAWPNGEFICFSGTMEKQFGVPTSDLASRHPNGDFGWKDTLHPEDYERLSQSWMDAVRSQRTYDVSHRVKMATGEFRWLRSTAKAQLDELGEVVFWLGTSIDIHEAVMAMEASFEREKGLRALIDTVPAPIWSTDSKGEPTAINRALADQTGISIQDLDGGNRTVLAEAISRAIHPEDRGMVQDALMKSFSSGSGFKLKYRQMRADGRYGWISGEAQPFRDDEGRITRWFGVCHDIDDEVATQLVLAEREARLALIVNTMPGLVWASSAEGMPTYFSKRLKEWAGIDIHDLMRGGQDLLSSAIQLTVHEDDQADVKATMRHSYKTGEPWHHRFRQRHADGSWRWVEARMEPLRDDDGAIIEWYGLELDIDNEVRSQESLRIAQEKLSRATQFAGMAELSASIAHEVSQPLAAVVLGSDACRRWLEMKPPNIERAILNSQSVVRDANIASEVVRRIRALFQHKSEPREMVDVTDLVQRVQDLIAEEMAASGIRLRLDLDDAMPPVRIDSVQIQQVLVNLVRNAVDAVMQNGIASQIIGVRTAVVQQHVIVEVTDSGGGIEDLERIFTPFFSTKESGMGMGLAISQSIVSSHGGKLWAENTSDGARISFSLPIGEAIQ
jgi:PAS domain S-box-containing protein